MPALRERTDDIPFLVEHFLRVNAYGGRERLQVTPEAMACLTKYSWPGNIRELRNVIERLSVLTDSQVLTVDALPPAIAKAAQEPAEPEGLVRPDSAAGGGRAGPDAGRGGAPPHPADARTAPLEQEARRGYSRHRHEDALQQAPALRCPDRLARRGGCVPPLPSRVRGGEHEPRRRLPRAHGARRRNASASSSATTIPTCGTRSSRPWRSRSSRWTPLIVRSTRSSASCAPATVR